MWVEDLNSREGTLSNGNRVSGRVPLRDGDHLSVGGVDVHVRIRSPDPKPSQASAAGAMRAGFELYRAFDRDAEDNRAALARGGRLTVPVLGMGGASSFSVPIARPMLKEVADDVTVVSLPACGHWVAEEQPARFVHEVLKFTGTGG